MAKRKLSQVRQEYLKQEKRIRNIIKREAGRGIYIKESAILPERPKRITRSAVERLREITPTRARYYGTIDTGSKIVPYEDYKPKQELPKVEPPPPPQDFIDDYYSEYEEPPAEEYSEPQEGELGHQAAEGLDDYYRAQEQKEKEYDLPYESDTVIQHICEMLNMSNYAEAKLFLHMVNSRINEIGKDKLTRIFTSNARDTRKWTETVCFDSKQERRQDALGRLMYLLYGDEEIPKYYQDTKLAIEYEGAKYSKNRAYRKSVAKKFKDNSL